MTIAIRAYTKVNRAAAKGTMVGVRLQPDQLAALDAWIIERGLDVSRPEAVRAILREALTLARAAVAEIDRSDDATPQDRLERREDAHRIDSQLQAFDRDHPSGVKR